MARDFNHGYVKASRNSGGALVHIPKGMLEALPDLDTEADLEVKRYASDSRNHVHLTFREAE